MSELSDFLLKLVLNISIIPNIWPIESKNSINQSTGGPGFQLKSLCLDSVETESPLMDSS